MNRELFLLVLSFATIYIVWGSTYLFAAFAVDEIPAFLVCAYRFCIAALLAGVIVFVIPPRNPKLVREEILNSVKAGFIFLGLGTGGAVWSLNFIDSGFSALIISANPLIIVLMIWLFKGTRPVAQTMFGIFLGIFGMFLLVSQSRMVAGYDQWLGILAIFLSMLSWSAGSIFVSGARFPSNQMLNISIQLLTGGITCFLISLILGESPPGLINLSSRAIFSMAFLIVFGSLGAFTAFNYLLKRVSPEKVVTNTYVNPVIAMLLGYLFNQETVTVQSIFSALIMLVGVFIINSRRRVQKKPVA